MWYIDRTNMRNDTFYVVNTETGEERAVCMSSLLKLPDLEGPTLNRPSNLCVSDLYIDPKYKLLYDVTLRRRGDSVSYLYLSKDYLKAHDEIQLSTFGKSFLGYSIECEHKDTLLIIRVDDKVKSLDPDTFSNVACGTYMYKIDITSCTNEKVVSSIYDFAMFRKALCKLCDNSDRYALLAPYSYVKFPDFTLQMPYSLTEKYDKLLVEEFGNAILTNLAKGLIYVEYNGITDELLWARNKLLLHAFINRDDQHRTFSEKELIAIRNMLYSVCDDFDLLSNLIAYYNSGGQDPTIISSFRKLCEAILSK